MNYKEQITHPKWQKKRLLIMQRDAFTLARLYRSNIDDFNDALMLWSKNKDVVLTALVREKIEQMLEMEKVFGGD